MTLSPENNPDTPVFTTPVSVASYFQFPSVPNDGLVYIVRLASSLSTFNYHYIRPESTVTATGVRAHVTFKFEPQVRPLDIVIYVQTFHLFNFPISARLEDIFLHNELKVNLFFFSLQPRKVEPEPSQGSFLTLPLLIILILLAVNHNKVLHNLSYVSVCRYFYLAHQ